MTQVQQALKTELAKVRQEAIKAGISGEQFDRDLLAMVDEWKKDREFRRSVGLPE